VKGVVKGIGPAAPCPATVCSCQRFPYGGREDTECVDWLIRTYHQAKLDPRFDRVACDSINDTPITMTRNQALANGVRLGFDFMLMVDSDMSPDAELRAGDPTAKPFFDVAVEHALASAKPCLIAAPYVGPPPLENIYVFQWANRGNTLHPEAANARMEQFTREEAARLQGIQAVGALPTGLMLIDLRCLAKLPQPWTYYEYHAAGEECEACHQRVRGPEERKASTEDVTFSRDLGLLGFGVFCAWDSWAGHNKRYTARKPRPYTTDIVATRRTWPGARRRGGRRPSGGRSTRLTAARRASTRRRRSSSGSSTSSRGPTRSSTWVRTTGCTRSRRACWPTSRPPARSCSTAWRWRCRPRPASPGSTSCRRPTRARRRPRRRPCP
jgi:hypothetical protein